MLRLTRSARPFALGMVMPPAINTARAGGRSTSSAAYFFFARARAAFFFGAVSLAPGLRSGLFFFQGSVFVMLKGGQGAGGLQHRRLGCKPFAKRFLAA